jgi:hypothetical protein
MLDKSWAGRKIGVSAHPFLWIYIGLSTDAASQPRFSCINGKFDDGLKACRPVCKKSQYQRSAIDPACNRQLDSLRCG